MAEAPRRILLTLNALDMSGIAFSTLNLIPGLLSKGARVMVLAREGGEREESFRSLGVEVALHSYVGVPLLRRGALAAVDRWKPHLVHAQALDVAPVSAELARHCGIPLVVTVNRLGQEERFLADHTGIGVIAVSDAIRERLTNRAGIDRERVICIPNGLDLRHFPAPRFVDKKPGLPVVGTYGRLAEEKGQRVFLEAAARLLKDGVDAEFLIMGQGPDKVQLRKLANTHGIRHRLTFVPPTSSDNRNLGHLDVFVEPSYQEGLGLSVLQAMATGVPVVASGVGGIYNLIEDGETGVLVNKGDPEGLSKAIRQMLNRPAERTEMARAARQRVEERFESSVVAKKVLQFYSTRAGAAS